MRVCDQVGVRFYVRAQLEHVSVWKSLKPVAANYSKAPQSSGKLSSWVHVSVYVRVYILVLMLG